jgi:uncharacterized protein YdaU (DUF1376 family)
MPADIWFPLYAADYLSDTRVGLLTLAQQGILLRFWCHLWKDGPLPNDLESLVRLTGGEINEVQGVVSRFLTASDDGKWLTSPRLEEERSRALANIKQKSEAGKAGMKARWGQRDTNTRITEQLRQDNPSPSPTPTPTTTTPPPAREIVHKWLTNHPTWQGPIDMLRAGVGAPGGRPIGDDVLAIVLTDLATKHEPTVHLLRQCVRAYLRAEREGDGSLASRNDAAEAEALARLQARERAR